MKDFFWGNLLMPRGKFEFELIEKQKSHVIDYVAF